MRKTILTLFVLVIVLFAGCAADSANEPKILVIPEAGRSGGYAVHTETLDCTVVADGACQYTCISFTDGSKKVELYIDSTELYLLDTTNGVTSFYQETHADDGQLFENPVSGIFDMLKDLTFRYEKAKSGTTQDVFEATQVVRSIQAESVSYAVHLIEMDWIDGQYYAFRYYEYADGATLISAEAPNEINPLLQADTPWRIDLSGLCICNRQTDARVPLTIITTEAGEGLSPDGGATTVLETEQTIRVCVNPETKEMEKIFFFRDPYIEMTVLNTVEIQKPKITEDMKPIDSETLQLAMLLVYTVDALINE